MTDSLPHAADHPEREERLARLVERLLEEVAQGVEPDFDALRAEHPDLIDEARELIATAELADALGSDPHAETLAGPQRTRLSDVLPEMWGDYEILDELGRGGMGIVYLARQQRLGRTVALKVLQGGAAASDADRQRFRSEAEAAARLDHPHIVPLYEVGEHAGQPYLCMKYIAGETLARRLQAGPLTSDEAVRILLPLCSAVTEAHAQGILHRDLKPANILIDERGQPYITDFGLAKLQGAEGRSLTESGAILGTPGYLSPELASAGRQPIGVGTDVYSLGAILYAMLTGRPPFQGATSVQTIMQVLEQDPVPPRLLNPDVDPDLQLIALKCLQKPVDLRYAGASDLERDLRAWQNREPISARSSRFRDILNRAFRESPHAVVLENWGLLWMWHALVLLALCLITNVMQLVEVTDRTPYVVLWTAGTGIWAAIFWNLRHRAGPITFVERQIAHVWAGSMAMSTLLFAVEALLDLPVLALSPVLGLIGGAVFLAKAGILSGQFYAQACALFLTGLLMAWWPRSGWPNVGISLFGLVSAASFFVPGWMYRRGRGG